MTCFITYASDQYTNIHHSYLIQVLLRQQEAAGLFVFLPASDTALSKTDNNALWGQYMYVWSEFYV